MRQRCIRHRAGKGVRRRGREGERGTHRAEETRDDAEDLLESGLNLRRGDGQLARYGVERQTHEIELLVELSRRESSNVDVTPAARTRR